MFYAADEPYAASGANPFGNNLFEGQPYLFFYKKGMEDQIKKYPPTKIIQIFRDIEKKKEEAYTAQNSLPKKINPVQAPTQKEIIETIKNAPLIMLGKKPLFTDTLLVNGSLSIKIYKMEMENI
ncbi:hypothetical protein JJC04_07845 [Flavobacterium covae]|nr:hypothetical protein [Flavobacterium covae]QYS92371.1 hypothetical protein JJC04_07845 [Flavobacterium covae]